MLCLSFNIQISKIKTFLIESQPEECSKYALKILVSLNLDVLLNKKAGCKWYTLKSLKLTYRRSLQPTGNNQLFFELWPYFSGSTPVAWDKSVKNTKTSKPQYSPLTEIINGLNCTFFFRDTLLRVIAWHDSNDIRCGWQDLSDGVDMKGFMWSSLFGNTQF